MAGLRAEPDNPHDKNAVAVVAVDTGAQLGYFSRELAPTYQSALLKRGGAESGNPRGRHRTKPSLGVRLDLTALNRTLGIDSTAAQREPVSPAPAAAPATPDPEQRAQALNVRFNRARRAERDVCELLGLARGLIADGVVTASEAQLLRDWVARHEDALDHWAVRTLHHRLTTHFEDGVIDEAERADLALLLNQLVGGELSAVCDTDAATALPLDQPPPPIQWTGMVYVFTGQFAWGPRQECEREVTKRGGTCAKSITKRTSFLVIGTFGSMDWVHTAFGRKIEKAVSYRDSGVPLRIVAEDHWAGTL